MLNYFFIISISPKVLVLFNFLNFCFSDCMDGFFFVLIFKKKIRAHSLKSKHQKNRNREDLQLQKEKKNR